MAKVKRVTIEDVAARAGVHASTVSRALSRPEEVALATRARVEQVVAEMGFQPNRAARGLITGRTGNVAVIVPDITNPHFADLVRAAGRAAREADLQLLLVDTGEHPAEEVRAARSLAHEVDGFVVVSSRRVHREPDALANATAVFIDRPVRGRASVIMRAAAATEEAAHHLVSLGHDAIAYLPGPVASWAARERRDAIRRATRAARVTVHEVAVAGPTFEAAADAVDDVLATGATAVMAFNDQMALGVIAGLGQRGIPVPDAFSVIGCDDVPSAAMTSPALSTIRMPRAEAGATAVRLLAEDPSRVELPGTFVARGSTGPITIPRRPASGDPRGRG